MLRPSEDAVGRPDTVTFPSVGRRMSSPFKRGHQLVGRSRGLGQASLDVQIVLIAQGGLELLLVESPRQTARLLEIISEMAANIDWDGATKDPAVADGRPHPARTSGA